MELTKHSIRRFNDSLKHWYVEPEYADTMLHYFVYGIEPGSFFTSVLANDFFMAMCNSHPYNSISALKNLAKWILNVAPREAVGSREKVKTWLQMSEAERRWILEKYDLIYTEQEETWKVLNEPA